jgi:hypothetical protein
MTYIWHWTERHLGLLYMSDFASRSFQIHALRSAQLLISHQARMKKEMYTAAEKTYKHKPVENRISSLCNR